MTSAESAQQPGYYGKVPSNGDFISRRLPESFVEAWDQWLRAGIAASRERLGQAWMDYYLNGPIWRFALSGGLLGPAPLAGVLMPSVDKVGRYFPLTVAAVLPSGSAPFQTVAGSEPWFRAAEDLALASLEDSFDLSVFDSAVAALGTPAAQSGSPAAQRQSFPVSDHVCVQIAPGQSQLEVQSRLADRVAAGALGAFGYWWTDGSVNVPSMVRIMPGLPSAADFALLLTPGQGLGPEASLDAVAPAQ